jgi:protein-tyrosine phosphatase
MPRPITLILILLIPPAACVALREYRDYTRYPRRFAEVIPDALYRGGYPTAENIRLLHDSRGIRTVVNLTDEKASPEERDMLSAVEQMGLNFFRVKMPGDGRGDPAALDKAADAIANKENWPVFFHCAAGKQRSNAALAAYRIRHCGWSADQALAELREKYDLDPADEQSLCDHLQAYARRAETRRPNDTPPTTSAPRPAGPVRGDRSPGRLRESALPPAIAPATPGIKPLPSPAINPFGPASLPTHPPVQSKPSSAGNPKP